MLMFLFFCSSFIFSCSIKFEKKTGLPKKLKKYNSEIMYFFYEDSTINKNTFYYVVYEKRKKGGIYLITDENNIDKYHYIFILKGDEIEVDSFIDFRVYDFIMEQKLSKRDKKVLFKRLYELTKNIGERLQHY